MALVLTFEIGNSSIIVCCAEKGRRRCRFVLSPNQERTADEYFAVMDLLARRQGVDLSADIEGAIIASVVPQLTGVLSDMVKRFVGVRPLVVGPGIKSGLNIRLDDPGELGSNLVAAAVGAIECHGVPCAVINMGSAIAIGVIDAKGSYIGGVICPGVLSSLSTLSKSAAQLPDVGIEAPRRAIGRNTRESMQIGSVYGSAAMLDGMLDRIEKELGCPVKVVATGDMAHNVIPCCHREGMVIDDDLVMRGLCSIYARNAEK